MKNRGFTLIELIIVIVIIGILASIAAPMMQGVKAKAMVTEAMSSVAAICTALQQYYVEYGKFPTIDTGVNYNHAQLLPGLSVRNMSQPYGTTATDGKWPTLDGMYFSQECYYIGTPPNNRFYVYVHARGTWPDVEPNEAPKKGEVISTVDDPTDTSAFGARIEFSSLNKKFTQYKWSKAGL